MKSWCFGRAMTCEVLFFYNNQKPYSNYVFPLFNHSSIVTSVIYNRWHHESSRRSNVVNLIVTNFFRIFLNCSAISLENLMGLPLVTVPRFWLNLFSLIGLVRVEEFTLIFQWSSRNSSVFPNTANNLWHNFFIDTFYP